jgi:hypothetical protein
VTSRKRKVDSRKTHDGVPFFPSYKFCSPLEPFSFNLLDTLFHRSLGVSPAFCLIVNTTISPQSQTPSLTMSTEKQADPELGRGPKGIPHWRMVLSQGVLTPEIEQWHYHGDGTQESPFVVTWIDHDPRNPMLFSQAYKWSITINMAFSVLAVSLCSSAFSGGRLSL